MIFPEGSPEEIANIAEEVIKRQKRADEILAEVSSQGEEFITSFGRSERVFHEVYVIGKAEAWHPKDRGSAQMGWAIYPLNPHIGDPDTSPFKQVEAVSFADVDHITPKPGDIAHVRRLGDWVGRRLSIRIILDDIDQKEVLGSVESVDQFIKSLPNKAEDTER